MFFFSLLSHYQQNEWQKSNFRLAKSYQYYFPSVSRSQQQCHCSCRANVPVTSNLLLAMVSLAVAVSVTVRMALFWACQLPMSPLSLKAPQGLAALGKVWALRTDRCSSGEGRACHFHFNIFQGVMSETRTVWASLGLTA